MRLRSRGFSLAEVCLALGIAAFAMLAIFGLLPVGIGSNQVSIRQTEAINLATGIVEDLRQAPSGSNAFSPRYQISLDQGSSEFFIDASGAALPQDKAAYRVKIALAGPPSGTRAATKGSVTLGWPAASSPPTHAISAFVALDRN